MRLAGTFQWFRQYGGYVATEVGINIVLPIILFDQMQPRVGDVAAVIISGVPSLTWTIVGLIRDRKLDVFSSLILLSIVIAIPTYLISGSPKMLLMRDNMSGVIFGILFLGSAAIGRPLMYGIIHHFVERGTGDGQRASRSDPIMKRAMTVMTVVFGVVMIIQALALSALVFALSIHNYLVFGPIIGWLGLGALAAWCVPFYNRARRRSRDAGSSASSMPGLSSSETVDHP